MPDWISFWDTQHSIYVNDRHRDVHYRAIAKDLRDFVPSPEAVVMDCGCGEALHADIVAAAARRLVLVEAAPGVVAGLRARFAANARIEVWTPERLAQCPDATFDLIVLHSVAQYLSAEALDALLGTFRRIVRAGGRLLVGDIIPPNVSALADAMALLRFAAARGFLGAALLGLARTSVSDYPQLRKALGLTRYDEAAMLRKLGAAGFAGERIRRNIGHSQGRMAFLGRPA